MNTFGLNRHLNSFGLSYPGYWFIIPPEEEGGSRPYIAYGTTEYIASELSREYPAHSITLYTASSGGVAVVTREFAAVENREYSSYESDRNMLAEESLRFLNSEESIRNFVVTDITEYTAYESPRAFIAKINREYNT